MRSLFPLANNLSVVIPGRDKAASPESHNHRR